ncbi:hypothetical protein [Mycobacterium lepromatosis]
MGYLLLLEVLHALKEADSKATDSKVWTALDGVPDQGFGQSLPDGDGG